MKGSPPPYFREANREAHELGHGWIGVEHLLLALQKGDSPAARALDGIEIRAAPPGRSRTSRSLNPALGSVFGFVEGYATGREPTAEDALIAALWEPTFALASGDRGRAATRLRELGVEVPELPPDPEPVDYGEEVRFPLVRLNDVLRLIHERRRGASIVFNHDGRREAWVKAERGFDLEAIVREATTRPSGVRDDAQAALNWSLDYLERVRELPVLAQVQPGEIRAQLPGAPPESAEPFADVLRDLDELLLPGITHWNHPRFFAYFAVSAPPPGILAELLAATMNVNAMVWSTSPAATELEQTALDWLAQLLGLPREWHGHIEDTASTATLAALAAARGLRPGGAVYASEQANFSVEKAARLLGLEYRTVPVDDEYRMLTDFPLDEATAVVATVGTTATTSVDPVAALADRCAAAGVWLHVDAAYAGAAWVCPELRDSAAGCERADSLVVNPHKWLFTPIDCSALWTRRPEALHAAFAATPEYLRSTEDALNLKDYGPALGRRFRALKLWATMRYYGRDGLQRLIREHVRLAQLFAGWVEAEPGWEIVAPHPFSTVCFRHTAGDNDAIVERANATGEIFVATTTLRGQRLIRLAIGNWQTTEADVARAWEILKGATC
jgi:aromatic-L-amino-acid/L-tryptophan decarboxylase